MGIYLRKSISVGPLRFNLSKSGVGVSAGVKGLRFGTGPRGNYVHMGRGGLYYRATLPPSSSKSKSDLRPPAQAKPVMHQAASQVALQEIESASVFQIVDSSSRELLNELNQKRQKSRKWPAVAVISFMVLCFGLLASWPLWLLAIVIFGGIAVTYAAHAHDTLAKTVVLFYDFDKDIETAYAQLHASASKLAACSAAWHIEASGKVHDKKYHAGASDLVRRKSTTIRKAEPPFVKTNVETIALGVGRQTLYFFS